MTPRQYERCALCSRVYNTSAKRDRANVFICADCAEKKMAKVQHRPAVPVYDRFGRATVTYEWKENT